MPLLPRFRDYAPGTLAQMRSGDTVMMFIVVFVVSVFIEDTSSGGRHDSAPIKT
jgi:hypothetical protein